MNETDTSDQSTKAAGCPFHGGEGTPAPQRKTTRPEDARTGAGAGALERVASGVWRIRGYETAKTLLRAGGTQQAGFQAEQTTRMPETMRPPILFQEGELHRDQRTKAARFFTPTTTSKRYRDFMEAYADELVGELTRRGRADLSDLSMRMAVQVAARVVGLTESRAEPMARRIESFFEQEPGATRGVIGALWSFLRNQWRIGRFYLMDVRPAIRARRKQPQEDVISHLLEQGYNGLEILTECITYGAAGMATTREFISAAAWHMLEHPDLRARYLAAGEKERHAILHELLRLEPVVGRLYRRVEQDVEVQVAGESRTIPAGDLVEIDIYGVNADEAAVGEAPLTFCPERTRAPGVQPYAMSFGDGHHRCPGAFIAIQETDIFLCRLLALEELEMDAPPRLSWNEVVKGYEIRDFRLRYRKFSS